MPALIRPPYLSAMVIGISLAAVGCRDELEQNPTVTPAFTGVPAAAPGASGIRVVERSGPPPFRSVYGPGGVPKVLPPGSMGDPQPGAPTLEDSPMDTPPPPLEDDPLEDDPLEDDPFEDEEFDDESPPPQKPPHSGPGPVPPPSGIGL